MSLTTTDHEELKRYLLGELGGQPEEEVERLEARLLAEDELFELAQAVETDLLVDHFRGKSGEDCRELLSRLAASPAGLRRIGIAQGLAAAVSPAPVAAPVLPFPKPIFSRPRVRAALAAAAAVIVLSIGIWKREPIPLHPAQLTVAVESLRGEGQALPEVHPVPRQSVELRLDLKAGEPFASYGVSIRKEGQGTVWGPERLAAPRPGEPLVLAAGDLPSGTYEVEIQGFRRAGGDEPVGFPSFRVVRR
jgi:hypothetical protein